MITYTFPKGLEDFSAAEGYTRITVRGGELDFDDPPAAATLALIEKYGGKLAEAVVKVKSKPAAKKNADKAGK